MLAALRIESLAIIDSLEVRFERGLNVLTGETGAGKSILIDALDLLLGGRADPGVIRAGRDEASVEGLFVAAGLAERAAALGLPGSGDEILIRRTVPRSGRGRVHINGALATVSLLSSLTRGLVDLSGQHEHVSLLRREKHLDLLDDFGGLCVPRGLYAGKFAALSASSAEARRLLDEEAERARRRDYLSFQIREIDEVAPEPGEDDRLTEERKILAGAERLRAAAEEAEAQLVSGDAALIDRLGAVLRRIEEASRIDPALGPVAETLTGCHAELDDAGRILQHYAAALDHEPDRLAFVDDRLEALRHLSRKHGGSLGSVLERADEMRREMDALDQREGRSSELAAELAHRGAEVAALASALSEARARAAARLAKAVAPELAKLGWERATLEVGLRPTEGEGSLVVEGRRLCRRGAEEAEFLFCANPGEEARPLARTASGGELSRVLLALKRALAHVDPVESYVFDEIDAGIGGATGLTVGQMLRDVARDRQVLCVTHLPQVAAFADVHLHVSKEVREGRTHSRVERLKSPGSRRESLARMLSGGDGPAALAAADELLARARPAPAAPAAAMAALPAVGPAAASKGAPRGSAATPRQGLTRASDAEGAGPMKEPKAKPHPGATTPRQKPAKAKIVGGVQQRRGRPTTQKEAGILLASGALR